MSVFVILSLALAAMIVAVLVLAGLQLLAAVRRLGAAAQRTTERLTPLTEELRDELAVTGIEMERLQEGVARFGTQRAARRSRRR